MKYEIVTYDVFVYARALFLGPRASILPFKIYATKADGGEHSCRAYTVLFLVQSTVGLVAVASSIGTATAL